MAALPRVAAWRTGPCVVLLRRLEQLDGIPVGVFQLDLFPGRADFHLVAKTQARLLQRRDKRGQVRSAKHHAIPSARLLTMPIGHRPGARGLWSAQQQLQRAERNIGKGRQLLMPGLETKALRIEVDRLSDVLDLVAQPCVSLRE
jgi:hypothetical protein